jgi:hypothetical protein
VIRISDLKWQPSPDITVSLACSLSVIRVRPTISSPPALSASTISLFCLSFLLSRGLIHSRRSGCSRRTSKRGIRHSFWTLDPRGRLQGAVCLCLTIVVGRESRTAVYRLGRLVRATRSNAQIDAIGDLLFEPVEASLDLEADEKEDRQAGRLDLGECRPWRSPSPHVDGASHHAESLFPLPRSENSPSTEGVLRFLGVRDDDGEVEPPTAASHNPGGGTSPCVRCAGGP